MNTLKKGDKCQSPYGIAEIHSFGIETCLLKLPDGSFKSIYVDELTRIPSHAERMQAVLDIAWDVEGRLKPHETVELTVGAFVEFARHYVQLRDELEYEASLFDGRNAIMEVRQREITKALKGETL